MEMKQWTNLSDRAHDYHSSENYKRLRDGVHVACAVEDFVNGCFSEDMDDFVSYITGIAHPTLQQQYFSLILKSIKAFAEKTNYDGRNKYTVETAKKLYEAMQENGIGERTPLI